MRYGMQASLLALTMIVVFAPRQAAAEDLVDARDPEKLVSLIQGLGYRALLETDEVGDPLITSSVGGTRFTIIFYGCDEQSHDNCDFLLYKVGYDLEDGVDLEVINEWNATQLVGRAYRDDVRDPWLEMAWNVEGGVSTTNFETTFEWWEVSVGEFEDLIGF